MQTSEVDTEVFKTKPNLTREHSEVKQVRDSTSTTVVGK